VSVGMHDTVAGLNPVFVIRSMFQVPGHYALTLVVFVGLLVVQGLASYLGNLVPYAGVFINKFIELWSAMFLARVLGTL
jgi:hypothetical protein